MGPSAVCEHCSKKFKVFSKRRKCLHCMAAVCRACYEPHLAARHPHSSSMANISESWTEGDGDEIHFQSPMHASGSGSGSGSGSSFNTQTTKKTCGKRESEVSSTDLFDDLEGLGVVEVEENDEEDDDDGGEEDLLLGEFSHRASMEEEETQFREFTQIQHAVEKWTRKEVEVKKQQRLAKQSSIYATKPVPDFGSLRDHQQRELFSASYAVFVTLIVWLIALWAISLYARIRFQAERTVTNM